MKNLSNHKTGLNKEQLALSATTITNPKIARDTKCEAVEVLFEALCNSSEQITQLDQDQCFQLSNALISFNDGDYEWQVVTLRFCRFAISTACFGVYSIILAKEDLLYLILDLSHGR